MRYILSAFALFLSGYSFCQGDSDLFRYSKTDIQGGARFEAMGGSFGALGADLSSSQINPAGFGRFSTTQFTAALGYTRIDNSLLFQGKTTQTQDNLFKLNTLGFVYVMDESANQKGYLFSQFSLGYNKLHNYTNSFKYEGKQFESLLDDFASKAYGTGGSELYFTHPFSSSLAWETFTINPDPADPNGFIPALNNNGNQYHVREVETKGGMNEFFLSYSKNYMNKLYLGGNIGIRTLTYDEKINHHEDVMDTIGNTLRSFDYNYHLKTKGNGFNFKLGAIYLPQDNFRLGLAFHSATYYNLIDKTDADMVAVFTDQTRSINDSLKPYGDYKYRLRTPPKLVGSIAYIFGTRGCVNVDVEYVNYKLANLRSTKDIQNYQAYDFTNENADAKKVLKSALNIRLGGELVFNSIFFIRGGMRFSGNAYKNDINVELGMDKSYSGGLGYKSGNFVLDLSYRYSIYSRSYTAFYGSSSEHQLITNGLILSANYVIN
jgi:long-subunit fatty acid transport protein